MGVCSTNLVGGTRSITDVEHEMLNVFTILTLGVKISFRNHSMLNAALMLGGHMYLKSLNLLSLLVWELDRNLCCITLMKQEFIKLAHKYVFKISSAYNTWSKNEISYWLYCRWSCLLRFSWSISVCVICFSSAVNLAQFPKRIDSYSIMSEVLYTLRELF